MKINIENNQQIVTHDKGFSKNRVTQFAEAFVGAALSTLKIFVLKIQGRSSNTEEKSQTASKRVESNSA